MTTYRLKQTVQAIQIKKDNILKVSNTTGGSIRGTKLPPERQILEITNPGGSTHRIAIGEWYVEFGLDFAVVMDDEEFNRYFEPQ